MKYEQARKVKIGDTLLVTKSNYMPVNVSSIYYTHDNQLYFLCKQGVFHYKEVITESVYHDLQLKQRFWKK